MFRESIPHFLQFKRKKIIQRSFEPYKFGWLFVLVLKQHGSHIFAEYARCTKKRRPTYSVPQTLYPDLGRGTRVGKGRGERERGGIRGRGEEKGGKWDRKAGKEGKGKETKVRNTYWHTQIPPMCTRCSLFGKRFSKQVNMLWTGDSSRLFTSSTLFVVCQKVIFPFPTLSYSDDAFQVTCDIFIQWTIVLFVIKILRVDRLSSALTFWPG